MMQNGKVLITSVGACLVCMGCSTMQRVFSPADTTREQVKVTVRFVAPPEAMAFAQRTDDEPRFRLANDREPESLGPEWNDDVRPFHAVLWGEGFNGADVTFSPTPLAPGPYMFGLFDPDRGAAYQGWIAVNNEGDDVLSALVEWRESIREQQQWLAFENKMDGNFTSRDPKDFKTFHKNLRSLRRLFSRIDRAVQAELRDRTRSSADRARLLGQAQVLMMPGNINFFRPWTRPAFSEEELSTVRAGQPLTKFVLVGDYERTIEKLQRLSDLRDDLRGCRAVLGEEMRRLENRRRYYQITDHLYHHGRKFVKNEQRLQETAGMIAKIDRRTAEHNRRYEALLFVAGLFAPDDTLEAFDRGSAVSYWRDTQ